MDTSVVILGGGYAALGAAETLGRAGVQATILEAGPAVGGLASCVQVGPVFVEGAYHHLKPHETTLIELIGELGLADRLRWVDTRMGFHIEGETFPFSTPADLLRFKPFNPWDKLRFGLGVLRTKYSSSNSADGLDAREWILRHWGQRIHDRMLGPMLQNKFGLPSQEISAAFLHGRIRGIARTKSNTGSGERMGYVSGSLQPLTDRWTARVSERAKIRVNARVESIERAGEMFVVRTADGEIRARHVINNLPLEVFQRLPKNFPFASAVAYQSAICGIFVLRERPTDLYWTNVIDEKIPFKVLVNQSCLDDYPGTVLYCGNYLRASDEFYLLTDQEILQRYEAGLRALFGEVSVVARHLFRARYATPIFDRNFSRHTVDLDRAIPGMVFAGNIKVYPHGRTLNNVIETGRAAARAILDEAAGRGMSRFTLLIPVRDEADNIRPLHDEISQVLAGHDYEVIVVNDGSTDGTGAELGKLTDWKIITTLPRGKSWALEAGLAAVVTDIVVMLDGDLQDDTRAIVGLVDDIAKGRACAVGCRSQRRDRWLKKRVPSLAFNLFVQAIFGRQFHDVNSGLKAFQVPALRRIRWFDGCHRLLPLLVWRSGGEVVERPTTHRARRLGVGKFNSPWRGVVGVCQVLLIAAGYYDSKR